MAAHIESGATFEARVREMGLGDAWDKLKEERLNTYAQFAFGANFTPGQADETHLLDNMIIPLVGGMNPGTLLSGAWSLRPLRSCRRT